MKDFIEYSGAIGSFIVNAEGAKLVLDVLNGKDSKVITGIVNDTKEEFQLTIQRNTIGDPSGMLDRRRYNTSNRSISYSMEVFGFTHPSYEGRKDFSSVISIMNCNSVVMGATIIKVSDPGYTRNPYRHNITGTDRERALDIYDIKRGGNTGFVQDLLNFCLNECAKELERSPASPQR
jgi:hypothetical protein